ncbi:MAG: CDGSH iron-sulfur domain-containing protein [Rubrobacteraceae bacterium]
MSEQTKITAYDNGPYLVSGSVSITDSEGNQYEKAQETVALCRCGASTNKPFCDGTHSKAGFEAAERAVQQEG